MRGVEVEGEGRRSFPYCCVRIHYWLIEFLPLGTGTSVFILYNETGSRSPCMRPRSDPRKLKTLRKLLCCISTLASRPS